MAMSSSQMKMTRDEVREMLLEHDVDGDGVLTKQEVRQAISSMGCNMTAYQKAHYGVAFADQDGDGCIDYDEVEKLVDYIMRFQTPRAPKNPKTPKVSCPKHCSDGKSIV